MMKKRKGLVSDLRFTIESSVLVALCMSIMATPFVVVILWINGFLW